MKYSEINAELCIACQENRKDMVSIQEAISNNENAPSIQHCLDVSFNLDKSIKKITGPFPNKICSNCLRIVRNIMRMNKRFMNFYGEFSEVQKILLDRMDVDDSNLVSGSELCMGFL
jgi:hypothetical protein